MRLAIMETVNTGVLNPGRHDRIVTARGGKRRKKKRKEKGKRKGKGKRKEKGKRKVKGKKKGEKEKEK